MNAKLKRSLIFLGIFIMCASSATAYAQLKDDMPGKPGHERKERMREHFVEDLDLTKDQLELLEAHRGKDRKEKKELNKKTRDLRQQLKKELERPVSDKQKIHKIVKKLSALHEKKLIHRVDSILGIKEILTPEQYKKFTDRIEKNKHKRGRKHNKDFMDDDEEDDRGRNGRKNRF